MNNDVLTKSINKGIPVNCEVPVILRYDDLQLIFDNENEFFFEAEKQIEKIFKEVFPNYETLYFHIDKIFEIKTNPESLEREIILSPESFKSSLLHCLNCIDSYSSVFNYGSQFDVDKKEIYKRIKILSKIKSEDELKKEFPHLFDLFYENKKSFKPYLDFKKNIINNPFVSKDIKLRAKAAFFSECKKDTNENRDFLNSLELINSPLYKLPPLDSNTINDAILGDVFLKEIDDITWGANIKKYIKTLSNSFANMLENYDYIIDELYRRDFKFSLKKVKNQSKLDLYIAFMHICAAEFSFSIEDKQKHLYYIANYFFENSNMYDSDLSLDLTTVPLDDMTVGDLTITPKYLYSRYRKLLIDNPDLRVVDSSKFDFSNMNLEDVESFMNEYLSELSLNWDFLPPDEFEDVPNIPTCEKNGKALSHEEKEKLKSRILDIFMEKKEFYGSTNPMYRIKGKSTFDGYIGYIYPNGKVVLDKFFDNAEKGIISYGNAVYVMNLDEFHELSKQSKSKIINEKLGRRFYHTGDWQERVRKEITGNISLEKDSVKKKLLSSDIIEDSE